ncbi:hypothetical protein CONCODRAFT_78410 [Conidiobolus coronatus NRRL 28638]|uniref:Uncharacterized protein n=1 Tax=Conidiobolus coronatus (strain ATCC 28846 / CBS 209.66 / NRRL 28638) TaxID=796925 RepID=A0A137P8P3_CONC2|nr:hypothetical protein CONCODRAFT_78410 [Conidiobolus coronatus NRRL 28638]|eukprot:KXN71349.1 hypothetical protein CONCODRAFT_78410 [Conidiobolus coronatus NRRL 28638]
MSSGLYIITLKEKDDIQLLSDTKSRVLESVKNLGGNLVDNEDVSINTNENNNVLVVQLPHASNDKLLEDTDVETVAPLVTI